jgi:hypothetical protein
MRRNEIELYAMRRGMTALQASRFADEVIAKRNTPRSYDELNLLVIPFALAAGITLATFDLLGDVADGVLDVGVSVVDAGFSVVSDIFSIFD